MAEAGRRSTMYLTRSTSSRLLFEVLGIDRLGAKASKKIATTTGSRIVECRPPYVRKTSLLREPGLELCL